MNNAARTDDVNAVPPGDAEALREQVSALVDGELGPDASARLLSRVTPGERDLANTAWSSYHLIGEVLRHGPTGATPAQATLVSDVMARIAAEAVLPAVQPPLQARTGVAANDPVFRWKLVAGLASLAAVVAVAWNVVNTAPTASGPMLAQSAPVAPVAAAPEVAGTEVVVAGELGPVIRDARLEELMAAHRQFGSMSALQMPAGFLRNATFETPQR